MQITLGYFSDDTSLPTRHRSFVVVVFCFALFQGGVVGGGEGGSVSAVLGLISCIIRSTSC